MNTNLNETQKKCIKMLTSELPRILELAISLAKDNFEAGSEEEFSHFMREMLKYIEEESCQHIAENFFNKEEGYILDLVETERDTFSPMDHIDRLIEELADY
jgi:hypothetical protein